ncbi:uncharacterized protein LOC113290817 [Papaver somniferum]|uniref:uncharacterized protein LOC113290817 n=1 Tax=Papaver somniferum TaxID=3469 RepID=UPI000E6F8F0B|nr:uncharacterized protein LOC113290817 [Papaver somniferum]
MVNENDEIKDVEVPVKLLRDRLNPSRVMREPGVVLPATNVKFDIKPGTFSMLQERAGEWYLIIPSKTITTWDGLVEVFVKKFYPHHKTAVVRQSIQTFKKKLGEHLHDYVERFNELLYRCPHHGFDKAHMAQILYEGLDSETRMQVETISGVEFTHQGPYECFDEFIELAEKTRKWASMREPEITRNPIHRANRVDNGSDILRRLEALEMNQGSNHTMSCNSEPRTYPCTIYGDQTHIGPHCLLFYPNETTRDQVSVLHGGTHQGGPSSNPPPGFHRNQTQAQEPSSVDHRFISLEEYLKLLAQSAAQRNQKFDDFVLMSQRNQQNNAQAISNLEIQISQLSRRLNDREDWTFPSQTTPNPKGVNQGNRSGSSNHNEHIKAIITLRSGKTLENSVEPPKDSSPAENETVVDQTSSKDPNGTDSSKSPSEEDIPERVYIPPAPFPQRLAKKKSSTYAEILDIFKQVKVNLPLLDAIKHVPAMAKFLKEMCTVKRDVNVHKKAFLTQQVSSIISQKYPVKFKDPDCPTVTCVIGSQTIDNALLDLRASVNLLPFSVYEQLGLG